MVVLKDCYTLAISHKLEDGVAQPLKIVVRRVYLVREAEEASIRETADRGLNPIAVAQPRSDGVGADGLPRYVLR